MPSSGEVLGQRFCRGCGCSDLRACPGGCSWILLDIETPTGVCSACTEKLEWHPVLLANVGFDVDGEPIDEAAA
jgi:hypothetical protein